MVTFLSRLFGRKQATPGLEPENNERASSAVQPRLAPQAWAPLQAQTATPAPHNLVKGGEMASTTLNTGEILVLEAQIVEELHTCFDPEIPVNIYDLGLIYAITVAPSGAVDITMTLTAPGCPAAGSLPGEVEAKVAALPGVTGAKATVVWDPSWDPSMMSEAARLELGLL